MIALTLCGGDRVEDLERLEADAGFAAVLRRVERVLLSRRERRQMKGRFRRGRGRALPSPSALSAWLERFHDAGDADLLPFPTEVSAAKGRSKLFGLVTNRELPGDEVIRWYRERCGKSGEAHAVMKHDLAGARPRDSQGAWPRHGDPYQRETAASEARGTGRAPTPGTLCRPRRRPPSLAGNFVRESWMTYRIDQGTLANSILGLPKRLAIRLKASSGGSFLVILKLLSENFTPPKLR